MGQEPSWKLHRGGGGGGEKNLFTAVSSEKKRTKKFQPMMHLPSSVTLTLCSRTLGYDLQKNAQSSFGVSRFFPHSIVGIFKIPFSNNAPDDGRGQ